jgi:hypothetical protein
MESGTITQTHVDALLAASEILTETKFGKLTVVTVKLPNGFILSESSGCVDPANYSEATGRAICLDKIKDRIWFLEGYRLQCDAGWIKVARLDSVKL